MKYEFQTEEEEFKIIFQNVKLVNEFRLTSNYETLSPF